MNDVNLTKIYYNYRSIEKDLGNLLNYIDLDKSNYQTTSAEIRKIILASCSMIELSIAEVSKKIGKEIASINGESKASALFRTLKEKNISLENVALILNKQKFHPWLITEDNSTYKKYKFDWWDAYNSCKHDDVSEATFEMAILSVMALFVATVYLTSNNSAKAFWHDTDLIKISTQDSHHPIDYNRQSSLFVLLGWKTLT